MGGISISRRSVLFFFHRDGDCARGRQAHLVTLDAGDQPPVDGVVMALV